MRTNEQFRIVIFGAGEISRQAHVPAVLASPITKLAGIVDPDIERAAMLCRSYDSDAAVSKDLEGLGVSFDGAIVATPNDLHASVATSLIDNNIPVLIEKPIATDVNAAQELASHANSKNVTVAVGYHTRHSGACRLLKYAVESEHFGRVIRFAHQDGGRGGWSPVSGYNLDTGRAGGGVLVTTGTHFLDRVVWLWGMPDTVCLRTNSAGGPESHCIANFEFSNAGRHLCGSAIFSKVAPLPEKTVIQTTEGVLTMPSDAGETVLFRPKCNPELEYEIRLSDQQYDPRSLYQRQLEDFVNACRFEERLCVDAVTATQSLKLFKWLYSEAKPLGSANAGMTASMEQVSV